MRLDVRVRSVVKIPPQEVKVASQPVIPVFGEIAFRKINEIGKDSVFWLMNMPVPTWYWKEFMSPMGMCWLISNSTRLYSDVLPRMSWKLRESSSLKVGKSDRT